MRMQVGTVSIIRPRVYPRVPATKTTPASEENVLVEQGRWPVYREDNGDGAVIYWEMVGKLSQRRSTFESLGDGLYMSKQWDETSGNEVIIRSTAYTLDEFLTFFTTDPLVVEGPEQRLVFLVEL